MQKGGTSIKLIVAAAIVIFSVIKYFSSSSINELTGEKQYISLTKDDEIAIGINSAPQMAQEFGGLSQNSQYQEIVKRVGAKVVNNSDAHKTNYPFQFYVLADNRTVNAFALPGGPIFITEALLTRLQSEDQLAGVLGHEVGHVIARHSAEQMSKQELSQGIAGAAGVAAGDVNSAYYAQVVANMVNMKYGRDDELESDDLGVRFMIQAGYNPEALIGVMDILEEASGGSQVPEFQSTHPSPSNRREKIKAAIEKYRN
ncbi:M48 family metalloprotease [Empedobacter stercoris]|uniref:M48 family metalloprotease n=1 Tax=Empedobacter stercoris TaxID=1628248 RepID=A0ABX1WPX3_9FLAO|nr:M48 family metalloprotease [Empedobacter stercoris]MCA4775760.1 M48 family metalloprotease [Empedobacter stercoris]MCA4782945.1 M48 family metalloprotease [Empedobacter stercoris]NOJ76543.1 M48 family metalloprotease [Empedobacter stercoris]